MLTSISHLEYTDDPAPVYIPTKTNLALHECKSSVVWSPLRSNALIPLNYMQSVGSNAIIPFNYMQWPWVGSLHFLAAQRRRAGSNTGKNAKLAEHNGWQTVAADESEPVVVSEPVVRQGQR